MTTLTSPVTLMDLTSLYFNVFSKIKIMAKAGCDTLQSEAVLSQGHCEEIIMIADTSS